MLIKLTILGSILCLFSLAGGFEVTPTIEDGIPFIRIGHGYYYIELKTTRNWFDAFAACRQIGANLIAFETTEEWVAINEFLWRYKIMAQYWTAGTDLANQGKHVWLSTGQPISLNLWAPTMPDNYQGVEHCDELGYNAVETNYNSLNDDRCDKKNLYICEASERKTVSFVIS
ncbi:C-type lectin 37Da-like [Drosophila kikkawai]|uniref:C-type lectin 37Da-like n=1 Tax=Drosophila kikkawai TaxID=30033 RepID=A0A6P4JER1_DROKI|nr:C-type lectin 37Da-like [Drosophila kikkawai]